MQSSSLAGRRRLAVGAAAVVLASIGLVLMAEIAWLRPSRVHIGAYVARLGLAAAVGVVSAWLATPRRLFAVAGWALAGALALMALTLLPWTGEAHHGARRTISIATMRWLPGPVAAVAAVLAVASAWRDGTRRSSRVAVALGVLCLAVLHLFQPHFSNLLVLLGGVTAALAARARTRRLLPLLAGAIVAVGVTASQFGYVQRRVRLWRHPEENRDTAALRSIREGAAWLGSMGDPAPAWRRLSSPHADYVLAFVLERHGRVGAIVVMGLAAWLVVGVWGCAGPNAEPGAGALCMGLGGGILVAGLVHTLVCLGAMPVTGMSFPLVGSGGSSLTACALAIGMAAGVGRQE